MYEAYFGLSSRPFAAVPRVDRFFPGVAIEGARQTLARCVERAEGVGMVVGPSGTGKTLLCLMLAEQFKDSYQVALLSSGRLGTRRALLQAILFELGQPYREMDEGELRLALVDHLIVGEDRRRGMLLLVDEAHTLPLRLLDEIRMITNLVSGGQPRTRLVLVGGAALEERFASPKLDSFNQRIAARCYLESFNRDETQKYIHAQIGMAGGDGEEIVPHEACYAVYQATDGVPRLINQVCDHALLLACAAGRRQLDRAVVEEAWADLQQLPTPWNGDAGDEKSDPGIIEFGGLDDEPEGSEETAGGEQPTRPMLRISPESDEPSADPVEQVERVQQAISGLEDDFQPAGSIGPELELVFDDLQDPFSEEFREEEVVVYRCESGRATPSGKQAPADIGPNSADIGGVEPFDKPALADEKGPSTELRHAPQSASQEPPVTGIPETAAPGTQDRAVAQRWEQEPKTVPMHRRQRVDTSVDTQAVEPDEEDLIIVEEGYDDSEPAETRSHARVRRQEYAQLFARLRRGS